ncbi:MAG: glycosyl hydrolase family 38, partial [Duncaniella sp.]|nr:glycosyl hydrolase family 38 [Duncaniella sp.]
AYETAMNRMSAARLASTGILWCMYGNANNFPHNSFNEAWKNVSLFSEHTWGAAGSGQEPNSRFTKDLWSGKKMFADSAHIQSTRLFNKSIPTKNDGRYIHVANTTSWMRTDAVVFDGPFDAKCESLVDHEGKNIDIQRLHDGRFTFIAKDVPPLSSVVYKIVKSTKRRNTEKSHDSMAYSNDILDNGLVRVKIEPQNGTIKSLKIPGDDFEYVADEGLNMYHYSGHRSVNPVTSSPVRSITLVDNGPVRATLQIVSDAPGCDSLIRYISLYRGLQRVDIENVLEKQDILNKENVRFVFPFNFPHPDLSIDLPMSEMHPEREQLSGVNKHYYSIQNALSVSDLEHGVCLTSVDAPFVEFGSTSGEDYRLNPRHGYGWWRMAQLSPVVYSWVMTNTWGTNYKASQGGRTTFHYTIEPANPHDLCLKQRGQEREHPLVTFRSDKDTPARQLFRLTGNHKIAVSGITQAKDGSGYIIRLHNMDKETAHTSMVWGSIQAENVARCDWRETPLSQINPSDIWLKPYEYTMIKITIK